MKRSRTLLAGWLALLSMPVSAEPIELLTNPSFEQPVSPQWGPAPTNWTIGAPEPAAVNYAWLQPIWSLTGDNPDGDQIAALFGNCRQTVGVVEAGKLYTFRVWVYFRSNQPFYGDLTTTPWSGGMLRFINDPGAAIFQNMPSPLPIGEWFELSGTVDTSLPVYDSLIGQPLYAHFWSTGAANEILLDHASLTIEDAPPFVPPNYHVSSSEGNDANDGLSPETAWATFANLQSMVLAPGTSVNLKRGDIWPGSKLTLEGKGTAEQPIRLTAYGEGRNPIITGINRTTEACVVINNGSHWEIDSLDLRDAKIGLYLRYTGGNTDGTGAMFNNENMTISHLNVQGMNEKWSDENGSIQVQPPYELSWGAGIWIGGSIPSPPGDWPSITTTVLDGLTVRHCSFQSVSTGVGNGWYFPAKYTGRMTNILLEDSWVTGCENGSFALFSARDSTIRRWDTWLGGTGYYNSGTTGGFHESTLNILIEDCEFAYNKRSLDAPDGVGMDFEGDTVNSTFRHNVVHNNDGSGLLILPTQGNNINLQMLSNTFWNNSRNPSGSSSNRELIASNNSHSGNFSNNGVYLGTDVNSGLAVYNNTSRWNSLFNANTGGNRTTTSWASVSGRPAGWSFDASVEGWGNANQWDGLAATGGALVGVSAGEDPYIESAPTWVNTRERRWVLVTMSQTQGSAAQIFFQTETDSTWTEQKSVWFPIVADGVSRTYAVDMGQSAEYRGVVTRFRLDPTTVTGSQMAIAEFSARLDPYLKSVTVRDSNELDVTFNQAMLPDGGVFAASNYVISGPGKGSLASNPSTVTQIPTQDGPVYRLKWHTGATNGDLAILTVTNAQSARGHAIDPINTLAFQSVGVAPSMGTWMIID